MVVDPVRSPGNTTVQLPQLLHLGQGCYRGQQGRSDSKAPAPNSTCILGELGWRVGVDSCQEGPRWLLLICIPTAEEVTAQSCTCLDFECAHSQWDHSPCLSEDKREPPAITDSTEACVEIHRGSCADLRC